MKKVLSKEELLKCIVCKKKFIPDLHTITFNKKKKDYEWDGHTYKPDCVCFSKSVRISVG